MKKILFTLLALSLFFGSQANTEDRKQGCWRVTVYLTNKYINKLDVNSAVNLKKIDKEWFVLTGHSFKVDLDKRTLEIELEDLGYIRMNRKGFLGPVLGVNKVATLEIKLSSWHTVYISELGEDNKDYEALYGLVSHDKGKTYQYEAIIPRREEKK